MKLVYLEENIEILEYCPKFLKPFYINMEPLTLMRRFRFWIDYKYGYKVFYLKKENQFIGYCTITSGNNPRFWFADNNDIIIGPYFIEEKYRNQGYSRKLVDIVINKCGLNWRNAYIYILNDNYPSIAVAKRLGGELLFNVHNTIYRKLIKDDNGEYGVYRIRGLEI